MMMSEQEMTIRTAAEKEFEALEAIAKAAREIRAHNPAMSDAQSQARAMADNPLLYTVYVEANRQVRRLRGSK